MSQEKSEDGSNVISSLLVDTERSPDGIPGSWYSEPKETMRNFVSDPHEFAFHGARVKVITLTVPIIANDQFYGVVGVDIQLNLIQEILDNLQVGHDDWKVLFPVIRAMQK